MKTLNLLIGGLLAAGAAWSSGALAAAPVSNLPRPDGSVTPNLTANGPMRLLERTQLTAQIVSKWGGYVKQVYGTDPKVWAKSMASTFAAADPMNLRRAAKMTTYEGMTATLLGQRVTDAQIIDKLAAANSPAIAKSLGSPTDDLVYTMITPCRIADTRLAAGGKLASGETRGFEASRPAGNFTDQGGASSDCGVPASPSAVVVNVTTVAPVLKGYLTVFPYGVTRPTAASVNYLAGAIVGNELIVKQTIGDVSDFSVYALASTHVVIDVVGYFMAPVATALENTLVNRNDNLAAGTTLEVFIACPSGYSLTGGGCYTDNDGVIQVNGNTDFGGVHYCAYRNVGAITQDGRTYGQCSRVPGR